MFTFPLDPDELFLERSQQFASWGIPRNTIARVQAQVRDSWHEGPGGWTDEWLREAEKAEAEGRFLRAAMLYGAARFPVIVTPMREHALSCQVACFEKAMRSLPVHFERRQVKLKRSVDGIISIHLYAPSSAGDQPLVLLSGGVDTGKMELHRLAYLLAKIGRFRVAAMDMPGTGENRMALTADAENIYRDLLATLAPTGRKAIIGVSFGGHWAAKLALLGAVDAAVNLGGPSVVFDAGSDFARALPNGMPGIIANAWGLDAMPDDEDLNSRMQAFSLRGQGLLEQSTCAPMLLINGELDQYIPQRDSTIFAQYPGNQVWLMRGMTHCAAEGMVRIVPAMITWLRKQLFGSTLASRSTLWLSECLLPERLSMAMPANEIT